MFLFSSAESSYACICLASPAPVKEQIQGAFSSDEIAFWDEHSLNQQRFYDMLCLTYGSNPAENKNLLGKDGLPPERAQRCPAEFKRVNHSWEKLLAPYLKS